MQITRTKTKYYLLSVLGALMVAFAILALAPSAQAQVAPEPTIDKECTPNPVQSGQQLTCIIDVEAAPGTGAFVSVTDAFPAGVTVSEANYVLVLDGTPTSPPQPCPPVVNNTVTCPPPNTIFISNDPFGNLSLRITIEATAEECGTFENTARAEGLIFPQGQGQGIPYAVEDTEEITVVGCEEEAGGVGVGGGGAAPITQEGEQESEAGEIDQSFEVS